MVFENSQITEKYNKVVYKIGNTRNIFYINFIPSGFDIETYTQYSKDADGRVTQHFTNMYIAQFQLENDTYILRTWDEVADFFKNIERLYTAKNHQFLMFIHNQSFEFSFMGKELTKRGFKVEVFARKKYKPMKIILDEKIIILDSAKLTGLSLAKMAENYCTTRKLKGDLDYSIPRNRFTKLTEKELQYCINDVVILAEFARYYADKYLSHGKMPMTQTMIANISMENKIKELKCQSEVYFLMNEIYPKNKQQYDYMLLYFSGAYTHASLYSLFRTIENVLSFDMTSQYPFQTMSKYFPMSRFRCCVDATKYNFFIENYCCLIDCKLKNVKQKYGITILSKHKLTDIENARWDNGRLYSADSVHAFITEVDLQVLKRFYDFEIEINYLSYAKRGKLPKYFRLTIAELFATKQRLKPFQKEKSAEYMASKQSLNGESYGACCTKLNFTEIKFENEWIEVEKDIDFSKIFRRKNKAPQWAIYITSWARYDILTMVHEIVTVNKYAYHYTDTDSLKCNNEDWIIKLVNERNKKIIESNKLWIEELGIKDLYPDVDFTEIGTFSNEVPQGITRFKTIGSKKYICEIDGEIEQTVAGLPKGIFAKWCKKYNYDPFEKFELGNVAIADTETEKLASYRNEEETTFTVTDLQGNTETITTQSYISLIPTTFSIKDDPKLAEIYYYNKLLDMED